MGGTQLQKYRLLNLLATGGMGEVFLARQEGPAGFVKPVVIKRILKHLASNEAFVQMFLNEARLAASISHSNVVQIYELGCEDGTYFIVMEYVDGRSLHAVRKALKAHQRDFPPTIAARICAQALHGLHYAHQLISAEGTPLGIVHRDVSPENILVGFNGQVKLVDFGIAKANSIAGNTRAGAFKGKFHYMAPEQVTEGQIDARTDIYAMGVVLYELLTGMRPFNATTDPALIYAIATETPPHPLEVNPKLPAAIAEIVVKAMAKASGDRYPTAADMADALERFIESTSEKVGDIQVSALMKELFGTNPTPLQPLGTGQVLSNPSLGGRPRGSNAFTLPIEEDVSLDTRDGVTPAQVEPRGTFTQRIEGGRKLWPAITGAAVMAAAASLVWFSRERPPPPVAAPAPRVEPAPPRPQVDPDATLRVYLDEVEKLAKEKRLGPALELIEKAKEVSARDPALNIRFAKLADSVEKQSLLTKAEQLLAEGQTRAAIDAVTEVLARDPENAAARQLLRKAHDRDAPPERAVSSRTRSRPTQMGKITIQSEPTGIVFIDDELVGPSPVHRKIEVGEHRVLVRAAGHLPAQQVVDVRANREARVKVRLSTEPPPAPVVTAPPPETLAATEPAAAAAEPPPPPPPPPPAETATPKPEQTPSDSASRPAEAQAVPPKFPPRPRLPAVHRARSSQDVFRVFQAVENQAIEVGKVSPNVARNVTLPLAQELAGSVMGAQGMELYPRAMYYVIVRQAALGNGRSEVGEMLRRAHAEGTLEASAHQEP